MSFYHLEILKLWQKKCELLNRNNKIKWWYLNEKDHLEMLNHYLNRNTSFRTTNTSMQFLALFFKSLFSELVQQLTPRTGVNEALQNDVETPEKNR